MKRKILFSSFIAALFCSAFVGCTKHADILGDTTPVSPTTESASATAAPLKGLDEFACKTSNGKSGTMCVRSTGNSCSTAHGCNEVSIVIAGGSEAGYSEAEIAHARAIQAAEQK